MATRQSAGILLFRKRGYEFEFFLVHPGGPFWMNKEVGAWSIPKGEFNEEEAPLNAALREFEEETGTVLEGDFIELSPVNQKAGKIVYAWAVEGNIDAATIKSNTFKMEWPYKSGVWKTFAEVDKAAWFSYKESLEKINPAQALFIEELVSIVSS